MRRSLDTRQEEEIILTYKSGRLASEIAPDYKVSEVTIRRMLKRRGVPSHSLSYVFRRAQGTTLNANAFDTVDEHSAYWIGFLMADGAVVGNRVALVLKSGDCNHLLKFRDFMSGTQTIVSNKRQETNTYAFQDLHVVNTLARYGVTERKTFTAEAPKALINNRHFWRGVVDGDGYLKPSPNASLELCGNLTMMKQYAEFIKGAINLDTAPRVGKMKSIWRVTVGGRKALLLSSMLYNESNIALDRKAKIATSMFI